MRARAAAGFFVATAILSGMAGHSTVLAERLATRRYTIADGLVGDYVLHSFRDSRGFMWFCTRDGLGRFDGVHFEAYGTEDGLSGAAINDMIETRAGAYWLATNGGGVFRMNPSGRRPAQQGGAPGAEPLFEQIAVGTDGITNRVNVLFEDHAGRLWAGTDDGLFRLDAAAGARAFQRVFLPFFPKDPSLKSIRALAEDEDLSLWIAGGIGLRRRLPDGRTVIYGADPATPIGYSDALVIAAGRLVWAGFRTGLLRLEAAPVSAYAGLADPIHQPVSGQWFTAAHGLPDSYVSAIHLADDGRVWLGTARGLGVFDGRAFRAFGTANGIPESQVTDIVDDRAGGLWLAGVTGVTKIIRNGLVTFDRSDGMTIGRIHSILEGVGGRIAVVGDDYSVSEFDGSRFTSHRPALPASAACAWLSWCGVLDREGDWWAPTTFGLYRWVKPARLSDLASRPAGAIYTASRGLPDAGAFNAFEDTRGNIWVGTRSGGLSRWNRSTDSWHDFTAENGMPPLRQAVSHLTAFAEDRSGAVWVGFDQGDLVRFQGDRVNRFESGRGAPSGSIGALFVDSKGRLWVGTNTTGLHRADDPTVARPAFVRVSPGGGLSSTNVRCLVEDDHGRVYAGTSRGVDRIDPEAGTVSRLSPAEGLASAFVTSALRDRRGALWFGTINGLSRLDPAAASPAALPASAPRVYISSLRVSGADVPMADLGDSAPAALVLQPDRAQLEIAYFGFSFEPGEPLRYQYRLRGVDADWNPPTELRRVNYARLSAGDYWFDVRAVRADGRASDTPAVVRFTILPPFYARWWFVALAAGAVAGLALAIYRMRVAQLLRVERVRARIATDLHDDIGASLSQIAILAEVAQGVGTAGPGSVGRDSVAGRDSSAAGPLARIAETSRGLVDSMSDIVWAINPEVDSLSDLAHRIRRFVGDTLGASDIDVHLSLPEASEDLALGADVRREVFLILKESVTNVAKHAGCTRVDIALERDRRRLRLRVSDNGRGYDPAQATDGNGVASMRRRVSSLGGTLGIDSAPGCGTTISFDIELRR